jgi:plasmid stability protein
MATLTVRDIRPDDYENLQRIAKANNRSVSAQVRDMIALLGRNVPSADQAVAELLEFRKRHSLKPRPGEDAVSMIRSIRGE